MPRVREVINGQIRCSKCRQPRPVSWYATDRHAPPLNITYRCRACRPSSNKLKVTEPDYEVIHVSKVKLLPSAQEKMSAGSWERVIQRAAICTSIERVVVYVGKNYIFRRSVVSGLFFAAKSLMVKITVQHGVNEVYVQIKEDL